MRKAIAIDFDGCLFETDFPRIIRPNREVIERALREKENGAGLILWTCREGELLDEAIAACKSEGLTFDSVNDSLPDWKEAFHNDPRKVGATEYWDDKAINPVIKTNSDKIRSLSDADLHTFLRKVKNRAKLILLGNKPELIEKLVDMEWLQSSVSNQEYK